MVRMYRAARPYFYIMPVVFLFAMGVLFRTTQNSANLNVKALAEGCTATDLSGLVNPSENLAHIDGQDLSIPLDHLAQDLASNYVLGVASPEERWIEVDLSEQKLKAWDGSNLFLETSVSSGLPGTPTPVGTFRVWMKLKATKMEGGVGRLYYYLPNVPYVMFFEGEGIPNWKGYGLHGTYWHNDFGTRRSHGCVNLPTPIAKELFYWITPSLPDGASMVRSSAENPGTRIVIHD